MNSRNESHFILPKVYLCGPITAQSALGATTWRAQVIAALHGAADCIDPTRDSPEYERQSESAVTRPLTVERLRHGKLTIVRNKFDLGRCDILLCCFLDATAVSIGSVGEIFWAEAMGKPVIIVREDDNIHNHDMLNEIAGWVFPEVKPAIQQIKTLLGTHAE
jgi:nucleoside 2-deoxyribosyltransferase